MADLSQEQVHRYLNKHPGFTKRYFLECIGQSELQAWITEQALTNKTSSLNQYARHNSVTMTTFQNLVNGRRIQDAVPRRSKEELLRMSQIDMFMELIRDVANELDVNVLCYKILLNVKVLTHSDRG
ncbi:hypothetical protein LSH36_1271g00005, partial [Paralvinella palmiformis]